jgi:hypothetical protein
MFKKVIIAGLLGGLTLMIWTLLINGIFGFRNRIDMKQVPNERQVYEILKQNIVDPGRYLCNPELTSTNTFPENEPVFSILYGGVGHEAAGVKSMLVDLLIAFFSTTIGAWLLSLTSNKILSSYPRKIFFFTIIGVLIAFYIDLNNFGIGNYPFKDALTLALQNIIVWTIVGLVISVIIRPGISELPKE